MRAVAPGRVNLIGEHTDYNDGLCLPFAIDLGTTVTAEPLGGAELVAVARDLGEEERFALDSLARGPEGWRRFVRGTVAELRAAGLEPRPARLELAGELPLGAGLGSSASLCVALVLALCALAGGDPPPARELARLCARVENDWVGAHTGLLDQLAVVLAREGHALRLDMRSLDVDEVPLDLGDHRLAALDSGAPRELAASGYNRRRAECQEARRLLGLRSLREAKPGDADRLPQPLAGRVRHVVSENERVDVAVAALRARRPAELGPLLSASHASLRDDYEVSVPAVERAVERAYEAGALGARVMGGGFGGLVLALFPPGAEPPPEALELRAGPPARIC
ncbi:MAG: galactokinase [Thermoleophilaceae bacterium]